VLNAKIRNYKCFGEAGAGFEELKPVNLIIGRNNSGKSSLIELAEYLTRPRDIRAFAHSGNTVPEVVVTATITRAEIEKWFPPPHSGEDIPGSDWESGRHWIGKTITFAVKPSGEGGLVEIDPHPENDARMDKFHKIALKKRSALFGSIFKRLRSDRDIASESHEHSADVSENGTGATTAIRHFLTKANLPSLLVEETLLAELNKISEPDMSFTDIQVQQLDNNEWEVYLGEAKKGRIPLSRSGSGLKTLLLVLVFLHLVPELINAEKKDYVFGFEELENNLHPAMQRRLFLYLREIAQTRGCIFFLTTHSSVVIDLFSNDDIVQIIHVQHDGTEATATRATTYVEHKGILDDLDVRASDLLQSNGVIWVEGPSDRLYVNRWIQLWSDGELREGVHYQCVFYGGRLLAHLSAEDPDINAEEAVKILRVNRNAILLIDSDRRKKGAHLNDTKKRIIGEIEQMQGMAWVTAGKEVENYIPVKALEAYSNKSPVQPIEQYEAMEDYLDGLKEGEGKRYERNKVLFAERMVPALSKQDLESLPDLRDKLTDTCNRIRTWNGLPAK